MKFNKKIVGVIVIALVLIGVFGAIDFLSEDTTTEEQSNVQEIIVKDKDVENESQTAEEVPIGHQQALKSAQSYIDYMAFSRAGLYKQLTSEYGDKFTEEEADYAMENVVADWKEEAVESAQGYLETMSFSRDGLYDQLTSKYGEMFTKEEAQYAIENVYK